MAAKKPIIVETEMPLAKDTKNTFRFDADTTTSMTVVSSIYIHKSAFGKKIPEKVKRITIEWE